MLRVVLHHIRVIASSRTKQGSHQVLFKGISCSARGVRQTRQASYGRSLERLREAAHDDRTTIQALADLPVSKARDAALDQTRQALIDTQDAMIDIAPQLAS